MVCIFHNSAPYQSTTAFPGFLVYHIFFELASTYFHGFMEMIYFF